MKTNKNVMYIFHDSDIPLDILLKFTKCLVSQRVSNVPLVKAECQFQAAWIEVDECR